MSTDIEDEEAKAEAALLRRAFLRINLAIAAGESATLTASECEALLGHIHRIRATSSGRAAKIRAHHRREATS